MHPSIKKGKKVGSFLKGLVSAAKGLGKFLFLRFGSHIMWMMVVGTIFYYKDSIPFLSSICQANEQCKVQYGEYITSFTPELKNTQQPVRTTQDETTGAVSVRVAIPLNTSATTPIQ